MTKTIVPIRDIMPIGRPIDPPPLTRRAGANTPVTWGDLFLLLEERPHDLRNAVLAKIIEIDGAAA